jgi:endonuclease YncB( thermonuclease family)
VGSFRRIAANGFTGDIYIALLIGTVITGLLAAAWLAEGAPDWLKAAGRGAGRAISAALSVLGAIAPPSAILYRGAAALGAAALAVGAGWIVWRAASAIPLPSLSSLTGAHTVEGRATALSGDRLRIDDKIVQLSGIEAPERDQTCLTDGSRRWRCGASAAASLAALVRRRQVSCALSGSDHSGITLGRCQVGNTDIAGELVRNGHVFATEGLFAPYASLEDEARAAKIGLWDGEAERPSDYRAQRWEEAKREAPDGCPIKGNVRDGRRVYVLPWSSEYGRIRVSRRRGERWFCSEAEAVAAGWQPLDQS